MNAVVGVSGSGLRIVVGVSLCMMCYLCPKNMFQFQISIVNFINRKIFVCRRPVGVDEKQGRPEKAWSNIYQTTKPSTFRQANSTNAAQKHTTTQCVESKGR